MDSNVIVGPWPVLNLGGGMVLPTYYLIISAVLILTTLYVYKRADKKQYSGTTAMDLYLIALVSGVVGARLLHVFYEMPRYYMANPMEIFYFWQGGFVFYGGALGAFLGGWLALKIKKQSFPMWLDFAAPIASLGYALGRLACFAAGCCYGKICDLPWAFAFTGLDSLTGTTAPVYLHPVQLYAVLTELVIFRILLVFEKRRTFELLPGHLFAFWVLLHSVGRIMIEQFRDDERGWMMGPVSISTLLSLVFMALAALFIVRDRRARARH